MIQTSAKLLWEGQKVLEAEQKARDRNMIRAGAATRSIWRRSIKYRKNKKSQPGSPPFAHTKGLGIRSIYFHYDRRQGETIVGPVAHPEWSGAEALEFGGSSKVRTTRITRKTTGRRTNVVRIKARPSGGPALETFSEQYPDLWNGAVKG